MTQGLKTIAGVILVDPTTGVPAGLMGADGKEYLLGTTPNGPSAAAPGAYTPGAVAITGGTINGATIGVGTAAVVRVSDLQAAVKTDISGTPGNGTSNGTKGRAAFAAAASTVTIASSIVTAASTVIASLGGSDATLTSVRVTAAAGSFTVTGNAAATATTPFDFLVVN